MSGVGGGSPGVQNLTLSFAAGAPTTVPSPATSGTFLPTPNGQQGTSLTSPAPSAQSGYGTTLPVFALVGGIWSLYAVDTVSGDAGQLAGGWSLEFAGEGQTSTLVADNAGNLYGTTFTGGTNGLGSVFKMTPPETPTTLVSFTDNGTSNKGRYPGAAMIRSGDGNFYGTTSAGGTQDHGTVFKITPTGTLTTLANFTGDGAIDKGSRSMASLVFGGDGNLYGTTSEGGTNGYGTIFRLPPSGGVGQVTTLVNFTGNGGTNRGRRPKAGLLLGGDGNFYGTTSEGGVNGYGTVFKMTPTGNLQTLFDFKKNDGRPEAPLIAAADGALYGTTYGPPGLIYRIIFPGRPKLLAQQPLVDIDKAYLQTSVNPAGFTTTVFLEYGTDGISFPNKITVAQNLTGSVSTSSGHVLRNLIPSTAYFYRFSATNSAGTTFSDVQSFTTKASLPALSLLAQIFPTSPPQPSGFSTTIIITPAGVGGWRYVGEPFWRASGVPAGANRSGSHKIEFRPVAGYAQPPPEVLPEAAANTTIFRSYTAVAPVEGGSLSVTLKPDAASSQGVPVANRAQWRLLGETVWQDSGAAIAGLVPGTHLIECKPVAGRVTPDPAAVTITEGQASSLAVTYFPADTSSGVVAQPVPFNSVANDTTKPYAFVGQIRSDRGSGSGFVLSSRITLDSFTNVSTVVMTAAQNVFDEATLSAVPGVQFLLRRDVAAYEPGPTRDSTGFLGLGAARGSYILDDYAAKRANESSPGTFSPPSLDSNVATIYFFEVFLNGPYPYIASMESGYLASDAVDNPFLLSNADKTLVGYPVESIAQADRGRMHASPPSNVDFDLLFRRSHSTIDIRGGYGFAGAPLFVKQDDGNGGSKFFPAAIHVGSNNGRTVVRAFDSSVIELIDWAKRAAAPNGEGPPTPGATLVSLTGNLSTTDAGALKVNLEPAAALTAGAGWALNPETTFRQSGAQKSGLAPGNYTLNLKAIPGFIPPSGQTVPVNGGQLTTVTYTYQAITALDTWRFANFGTYDNTGDAADGADFDKDGQSNLGEFAAGTNPKNGNDIFKMSSAAKSGNTFTAQCAGRAGRAYTLLRNTTLNGTWARLSSQGPLAADGTVTLSDASAPTDKSFYRIEVSVP